MRSHPTRTWSRRQIVKASMGASALTAAPMRALLAATPERRLAMRHLHTGESIDLVYWQAGQPLPAALGVLDHHLRDWRQNEVRRIDRPLFDMMFALARSFETDASFEIICGYRSQATNDMLRRQGSGVAKRSLHLVARAIDLRLPGVALADLRDRAIALGVGGVGYYPGSDFIHVDTGRVRQWGS